MGQILAGAEGSGRSGKFSWNYRPPRGFLFDQTARYFFGPKF